MIIFLLILGWLLSAIYTFGYINAKEYHQWGKMVARPDYIINMVGSVMISVIFLFAFWVASDDNYKPGLRGLMFRIPKKEPEYSNGDFENFGREILRRKELLPLLLGIDRRLDKYINKRLKEI